MYYLMIKEIEQTGTKYLCKRKQNLNDPDDHIKYTGSGKLWKRILKAHPEYTIRTTVLGLFTAEELQQQGLYYSEIYNIVKSNEWANLIPESGDGGDTSKTPGFLKAQQEGKFGRHQDPTKYIYNEKINCSKKIPVNDDIPEGWVLGTYPNKSNGPIPGCKVYHNGTKKIYIKDGDPIPEGFEPGVWYEGTTKGKIGCYNPDTKEKKYVKSISDIPKTWVKGLPPTTGKRIQTPNKIYESVSECIKDMNITRYEVNKRILNEKGWKYL